VPIFQIQPKTIHEIIINLVFLISSGGVLCGNFRRRSGVNAESRGEHCFGACVCRGKERRRARRRSLWSRRPAGSARARERRPGRYRRILLAAVRPLGRGRPPPRPAASCELGRSLLRALGGARKKRRPATFQFVSPPRIQRAPPSQGGARSLLLFAFFRFV